MTTIRPDRPLPAPLPYGSQAGRGAVPPPPPREPVDPDGPMFREDERTLWIVLGIIAWFVLLMTVVAMTGGL